MKLKKIKIQDLNQANEIIIDAISRLKDNGIDQWQNGYPNLEVLEQDIHHGFAYGLYDGTDLIAYAAVVSGLDPFYLEIKEGHWHTSDTYLSIHRFAIKETHLNRGIGLLFFNEIDSAFQSDFRVDTGLDNTAMQNLLIKAQFQYCGLVYVQDGKRMAFDKIPFNDDLC